MPNLLRALRQEIKAAARGESKAALGSIRTELESMRKALASMERRFEMAAKTAGRGPAPGPADEGRRARFSPRLMRRHREALGMSRKAYARLLHVSSLSIYLWEAGRTRPRRATIFAWQDLRKKGARELRALAGVPAPKRGRPSKAAKRAKPARRAKPAKAAKASKSAKRPRRAKRRVRRAKAA